MPSTPTNIHDRRISRLLKAHPLCRICKKPLTPRSLCTNGEPEGMHIRCANRTCTLCNHRVERKDRCVVAHRTFHKRCFMFAWNKMRLRDYNLPPLTWEQLQAIQQAFWVAGGTATQILTKHFPPTEGTICQDASPPSQPSSL